MAKLTAKQKKFCNEYLIDLNATQAAIRAGYSEKTAYRTGADNLRKPQIAEYIQKAMRSREKRTEITQDKVLAELAKIAFVSGADFAKIVTKKSPQTGKEFQQVELADTDSLPNDKKAAISNIKETKFGIAVESYDKVKALELLGRHLGMFKEKLELSGGIDVNNPFEGLTTEELRKLASSEK
ncbi:MAG: putative phage terminase, small subunit [Paenibacillus sp.]|nr:putative phage terminase, small subunit [Paenibacillus sp.]